MMPQPLTLKSFRSSSCALLSTLPSCTFVIVAGFAHAASTQVNATDSFVRHTEMQAALKAKLMQSQHSSNTSMGSVAVSTPQGSQGCNHCTLTTVVPIQVSANVSYISYLVIALQRHNSSRCALLWVQPHVCLSQAA